VPTETHSAPGFIRLFSVLLTTLILVATQAHGAARTPCSLPTADPVMDTFSDHVSPLAVTRAEVRLPDIDESWADVDDDDAQVADNGAMPLFVRRSAPSNRD